MKNLFLHFFLCCILSNGFAQHHSSIDSLRKLLPFLTGTERVDCLNELSNQYFPKHQMFHNLLPAVDARAEKYFNVDSTRYFASEAYAEALNLAYAHGIAEALSYKADMEDLADNFVSEEKYAREALMWYRKTDNNKRLAEAHFDLAWALYSLSQFKNSVSHFDSAFALYQSLKDTASMTRVLGITANVYIDGGNSDKAFEVSRNGLLLAARIKDEEMIRFHQEDIAGIYLSIGDTANCLAYYQKESRGLDRSKDPGFFSYLYQLEKNYDSADYYMSLWTDTISQRVHRFYLTSKGNLCLSEKKYSKALDNFKRAYALHLSAADPNQTMLALDGISTAYFALKNDTLALKYANQCLSLARQKKANHVVRMNCYKIMYSVYDHFQKNDSAYHYFKLYISLKDSVLSNQIKGKLAAYLPEQKAELLEKQNQLQEMRIQRESIQRNALIAGILFFLVVAVLLWRNNRYRQRAYSLLQSQKLEIENQRSKVEKTLSDLRSTQAQLIQSEKMASLGELTAGIAHEIQNPLNFVNNFSEVNSELISEMKEELAKGNIETAKSIADSIDDNENKIISHGKRADAIVKGMLQHSRSSSGVKEPTDINALADEYLRLAYHGLRAKDKSFNANTKTDFDTRIGSINVIPQDIGRVILNLITNAFYAVTEKSKSEHENYQPTVTVTTKKIGDKVLISVKDNGRGIPEDVVDKIFQPFFTTKPTGQGTGLGLSLSYDIVKAHGGELKVETQEGGGAEFVIVLPIV